MATLDNGHVPELEDLSTTCKTKIVDLKCLELPDQASDDEYRQIYNNYVKGPGSNARNLQKAIISIQTGSHAPVAFPTETVYGLGADATNESAVSAIFATKGRPSDNPLIVHTSSIPHLERLTRRPIPQIYKELVEKFWPGPLTILLPVNNDNSPFAKNVHPGQQTIGFRIPESKYARFFIAAADRPIAGPSANSSGKPSPTTAQHVKDDLDGKISYILDGGSCGVGVESTVVDGLHDPPLILRPGGISQQQLSQHGLETNTKWSETAIGYKTHEPEEAADSSTSRQQYIMNINGAPRAPGMKYRHYAPKGRLILFSPQAFAAGRIEEKVKELISTSSAVESPPPPPFTIGILSCHWPDFAGLPVVDIRKGSSSSSSSASERHEQLTPSTSSSDSTSSIHDNGTASSLSSSMYILSTAKYMSDSHKSSSPPSSTSTITETSIPTSAAAKPTIHNITLGPNITLLAQSLFSVLRTFDHLKCDYIFAETVSPSSARARNEQIRTGLSGDGPGTGSKDGLMDTTVVDAVADRLNKAASERVD